MATEVLFGSGNYDNSNGWTGNGTDIDEGISAADGNEISSDADGEGDAVTLGVANTALTDADTITQVDIEIRGRVTTNGGDEDFDVTLLVGGTGQGTVSSPLLTASHANSGKLNTAGWNVDWTQSQIDSFQVQCIGRQAGMPTANTWHIDSFEVTITYTPGATAEPPSAYFDQPFVILRSRRF